MILHGVFFLLPPSYTQDVMSSRKRTLRCQCWLWGSNMYMSDLSIYMCVNTYICIYIHLYIYIYVLLIEYLYLYCMYIHIYIYVYLQYIQIYMFFMFASLFKSRIYRRIHPRNRGCSEFRSKMPSTLYHQSDLFGAFVWNQEHQNARQFRHMKPEPISIFHIILVACFQKITCHWRQNSEGSSP